MATTDLSEARPQAVADGGGETVEFMKYTSFGNTFIIVDETGAPLADDEHRAAFARWALNGDFGIGGTDNVLYLRAVEDFHGAYDEGDFAFRIFEHDGSETLSCGNGLLSTAAFLHRRTGASRWGVLTELPTGRPRPVEVGVGEEPGTTWVNVGWPRPVSEELYRRPTPASSAGIDAVPPLTVPLPQHEPWAAGLPETITLSGFLVFTGEPHMMLIEGRGLPTELAERLWVDLGGEGGSRGVGLPDTPEMAASCALVHHVGTYVNATYKDLFPQGVHLNFARVRGEDGVIEYRTYERAIDCETLACGSGAVAMAHIAQTEGLLEGPETTFWPHRCRWYQPDASLGVVVTDDGFLLSGHPKLVCEGSAPRFP
jgi:diaminopimelate epimerase